MNELSDLLKKVKPGAVVIIGIPFEENSSFMKGPIYISLDMDVLDPAFAPGVSHHEPGGFSTREVLKIIQELDAPVVGGDIVEFNPKRDPLGITAMAAARFLKEIAGKMLTTKIY